MNTTTDTTKTADLIRATQDQLQEAGFQLSNDREWEELTEHIATHKYLINQKIGRTVSWHEAVFSWFDTVYRDVRLAIDRWAIRGAFPGKTDGQLYLAISTHWYFLKERDPSVTAEAAARDFAAHYGTGMARWFSRFLQPSV